MSDDWGSVYIDEDQTVVYRASSLGGCLRSLVAARRGLTPTPTDSTSNVIMGEGVLHEQNVLDRMEAYGYELLGRGQEEVELFIAHQDVVRFEDGVRQGDIVDHRRIVVRGHIDELCPGMLVEVKTMSDSVFKTWLVKRFESQVKYAWQVSVYMLALHVSDCVLAAKNRNTGEIDYHEIHQSPFTMAEITDRVMAVEKWAKKPDGEWPECDSENQWWCPFSYLHDGHKDSVPNLSSEALNLDGDFLKLVEAYHAARQEEDAARGRRGALREEIVKRMGECTEANPEGWKVTRKEVVQRRMDMDQIKKMLTKAQKECAYVDLPVEYLLVDKDG